MEGTCQPSRRKFISQVARLTCIGGAGASLYASPVLQENPVLSRAGHPAGERKFVPVMLTPYKSSLQIDFEGLSKLIDFYQEAGAKGFFANCLSSEMYDLDDEEKLNLVKHVVRRVNGKMPVVATGSFGNSIEARADYTKKMFDTGVDAVILITSHFAERDDEDAVLTGNLEKYLALTGNIPLGTYECPSPYKRILPLNALRFLLSTNRLVYHKDTSLDLKNIREKLAIARGSRLELYDAHTPNALPSMQMGAKGMSCIAGNFYPEIFSWMCKHIENAERKEDLQWLQSELTRVDSIISKGYSLSAKYFLAMRGLPIEINSRRNKTALTSAQKETLKDVYKQLQGWHERLGI